MNDKELQQSIDYLKEVRQAMVDHFGLDPFNKLTYVILKLEACQIVRKHDSN